MDGFLLNIEEIERVRSFLQANPYYAHFGIVLTDEYGNFTRRERVQIIDKIRNIIRQSIDQSELSNSTPQDRFPAVYDPEALALRNSFLMTDEFKNTRRAFK